MRFLQGLRTVLIIEAAWFAFYAACYAIWGPPGALLP